MEILEKDIVVEVDKKVAISFNKKYKDFININGEHQSLDLRDVKREIAEYLANHRQKFSGQKVFPVIYDYDSNLVAIIMKRNPEYEIYDILGFVEMSAPQETLDDDFDKAETKTQIEILKENEKIQNAREQSGIQQLESILEGLGK